jgi:nitrate reductase gamma subunit
MLLGLAVVAAFHLLPLLVPAAVLDLTQRPRTLWGLETAHLAAGLLALCGLLGLRRTGLRRARPPWKLRDAAFAISLGLAVATGVLTAIVHRWGLPWLAGWLTPELAALVRGEVSGSGLVGALPLLIRLHLGAGLFALVLLPFSRWRSLLNPKRLDPRRIPWRSLKPGKEIST